MQKKDKTVFSSLKNPTHPVAFQPDDIEVVRISRKGHGDMVSAESQPLPEPSSPKEQYAYLRHLLRQHLGKLAQKRRDALAESVLLSKEHALLMERVSPLLGKTDALVIQDLDDWVDRYVANVRLPTHAEEIRQARFEYRLITDKYKKYW